MENIIPQIDAMFANWQNGKGKNEPNVIVAQKVNMDYTKEEVDGVVRPVYWVSCYDSKDKRWFLGIYGDRIRPSFGVPYEEAWKLLHDKRVTGYCRGPDSPFGEPVMKIFAKLPENIGTKLPEETPLRDLVSHSYEGDLKFEKKCERELEFDEGYFKFDAGQVRQFGEFCYLDDKYVFKMMANDERFFARPLKMYWDTEWDMSMLKNEFNEQRMGEIKRKDYMQARNITDSFLNSKNWVFDVFTWHPKVLANADFEDEYVSRIVGKFRARLPMMPEKYVVHVHKFTNERDMLTAIINFLAEQKPDALIGYNTAGGWHGKGNSKRWYNGFDMPWMYHRMKHLQLPFSRISPLGQVYMRRGGNMWVVVKLVTQTDTWHAVEYFDVMTKDYALKDQKLDTLIRYYLGFGKHEHEGYVWEAWMKTPQEERIYNQVDTEGEAGLDQYFGMSEDEYNRALICGANWEDGREASKLHDCLNLRMYKDLHFLDTKSQKVKKVDVPEEDEEEDEKPTAKKEEDEDGSAPPTDEENKKQKYWRRPWIKGIDAGFEGKRGGHVEEVKTGLFYWVAKLDFEKFYPMSGMAANCGPETYINVDRLELDFTRGLVVIDKRPYLKREVADWQDYMVRVKQTFDHTPSYTEMQEAITNDLIGWKETKYDWMDLVHGPSALFRKEPIAKNTLVFQNLNDKRNEKKAKAKKRFKDVKNLYDFLYKVFDKQQFSFKGLTNARFGVTGMTSDRLYMIEIFNTFTLIAQTIIREVLDFLRKEGYSIIGGDTDSVFVQLKAPPKWIEEVDDKGDKTYYCEEMEELGDRLRTYIQEYARLEFNIKDGSMFNMDCEDINDWFLMAVKKHYITHTVWKEGRFLPEPKPGEFDTRISYKGVKRVRRETSIIAGELQDKLSMNLPKSEDDAAAICMEYHNMLKARQPWELCKVIALGRPLAKYSKSTMQFKAFAFANDFFNAGYQLGARAFCARVKYHPPEINGKKVPDFLGDVIAFDEGNMEKMVKAGIEFDFGDIEENMATAADEILVRRYNKTYKQLIEAKTTFDPFAW